jgi:hypothetical protein
MEEQNYSERESFAHHMHTPQKKDQRPLVGLFILLFAGVSVFGLQGITRTIQDPFTRKDTVRPVSVGDSGLTQDQKKAQTDLALKNIDTDKDGLSDYDEITLYGTSPFLSDSDGDGYDDKTEILTGHDPLCNEQTTVCNKAQEQVADVRAGTEHIPKLQSGILGPDGKPSGVVPLQSSQFNPLQAVTVPGFDKPMTIDELRNLTPAEIRAYLVRQGVSDQDVKNIDDASLMQLYGQVFERAYQKVIQEQNVQGISPSELIQAPLQPQPSAQQQTAPNPDTMSVEEIRELLRKSGKISEEDLGNIDDETLKNLAKQTYQEMKK